MNALGTATAGQLVPPVLALAQAQVPEGGRRILSALRARLRSGASALPDSLRDTTAWLDCRLAAAMDRQRGWLDEVLRCGGGRVPDTRRLKLGLDTVSQSPRLPAACAAPSGSSSSPTPRPSVRAAAASVAGASKRKELAPELRPLLRDPDLLVRAAATDALATSDDVASAPGHPRGGPERAGRRGDDLRRRAGEPEAGGSGRGAPGLAVGSPRPRATGGGPGAHRAGGRAGLRAGAARPRRAPRRHAAAGRDALAQWRRRTVRWSSAPDLDAAPVTVAQLSRLATARTTSTASPSTASSPTSSSRAGTRAATGKGGPGSACAARSRPGATCGARWAWPWPARTPEAARCSSPCLPQPHLDGRYTIIGTVVSGMEALDGLAEGDGMGDWLLVSPVGLLAGFSLPAPGPASNQANPAEPREIRLHGQSPLRAGAGGRGGPRRDRAGNRAGRPPVRGSHSGRGGGHPSSTGGKRLDALGVPSELQRPAGAAPSAAAGAPPVVLHATGSSLPAVAEQLLAAMHEGHPVVSTCEELVLSLGAASGAGHRWSERRSGQGWRCWAPG